MYEKKPASTIQLQTISYTGKPYQLLEATEKDKRKALQFYNHCPVPGHEISSVKVIYNKTFNVKFDAHLQTLQHKEGNPAFKQQWSSMSNPQLRQKTISQFEKMSKPHCAGCAEKRG